MFITRIFYGIAYFIVLIFEILKAELDVVTRVLDGKVEPHVVEIETVLKRPISQTILANSITLTPGTLSIDLDSENCNVSCRSIWIKHSSSNDAGVSAAIV